MEKSAIQTAVDILEKENSPGDNGQSRAGIGGPKTEEGKKTSSQNARTHGFCATTLPPEVEEDPESQKLLKQFMQEYEPHSATAKTLVHELWRHECVMRRIHIVEMAALEKVEGILCDPESDPDETDTACKRLDLLSRYRRTHERGFHDALRRLMALREDQDKHLPGGTEPGHRRRVLGPKTLDEMTDEEIEKDHFGATRAGIEECRKFFDRFSSNAECEDYMLYAQERAGVKCSGCGRAMGLDEFRGGQWRCPGCGAVRDVREGTLMEGTEAPVKEWMWAAATMQTVPEYPEERLVDELLLHNYRGGELVWKRLHGLTVTGETLTERVDACLMTKSG